MNSMCLLRLLSLPKYGLKSSSTALDNTAIFEKSEKIFGSMEKTDLYLQRISYILLCVINLLRSGERIGSQTHWQPTRSHALAGLENRCQLLLR
jgi:hypothetical protein